jgi:imidazolonepropionase-like amidohydrolase
LAGFRARGIRLGVGTDSEASVGGLDLLGDARAAGDAACLTATEALALCTSEAARAIGLEREVGRLRAGLWGDCAVIAASPLPTSPDRVAESVLETRPEKVRATFLGGRAVHPAA